MVNRNDAVLDSVRYHFKCRTEPHLLEDGVFVLYRS